MAVKEETITQALKRKNLKFPSGGVIVVYGPEEVLHKNLFRKLKEQFGSYFFHYGDELTLDKLYELAGERSLFSSGKREVNIIWQAEKFFSKLKRRQKERLTSLLRREIANLLVFSITAELKKTDWGKEPYKTLREVAAAIYSAKGLNRTQIAALIKKKFDKEGIQVSQEVVNYLLESFSDLSQLKQELDKLIVYALEKKKLNLEEVKELTQGNRNYTIFDFQNRFFDKDLKGAIETLRGMLFGLTSYEGSALIFQIEGLLLSTLSRLLLIKERTAEGKKLKEIAKEVGLYYPFQVVQYEKWDSLWSEEELLKVIKLLYRFDVAVKVKFLSPVSEFERFLFAALRGKFNG